MLDNVIDINYYPVEEARRSNFRHRPIGIGVQGLADAFLRLKMPFDSPEAAVSETERNIGTSSCGSGSSCAERVAAFDRAIRIL